MIHEDQRATAISKDERGIIHIAVNGSITAAQAGVNVQTVINLSGDKPARLLVDLRNVAVDFEAQAVYQMATNDERVRAIAFLASSLNARIASELFVYMGQFTLPARIFDDRDEAIAWLLTFDS